VTTKQQNADNKTGFGGTN